MSVNRHLPHIYVLPEDDANRQLAKSFHLQVAGSRQRQMQVLPEAGGWLRVLERFKSNHVVGMNRYPSRLMVLLIDFDGYERRLEEARAEIPKELSERVFILGALTEPEALKQAGLGSLERIGLGLAKDCREGTDTLWQHPLLQHNAPELQRLLQHVRPILFPSN
jgi:hypothetical protein